MKPQNTPMHTSFPIARTENLLVQELDGETLIYDKTTHKAFCLNATAALIWKACDGRNDATTITRRLTRLSDAAVPCEIVHLGLQQLSAQNLLAEPHARTAHAPALASRRAAIRTLGITAAIAIPTVTAIIAPTAAHAATGGGSGSACSTNSQCSSGLCINGICS